MSSLAFYIGLMPMPSARQIFFSLAKKKIAEQMALALQGVQRQKLILQIEPTQAVQSINFCPRTPCTYVKGRLILNANVLIYNLRALVLSKLS